MERAPKKRRKKATADRARTPEEKQVMRERILNESIRLFVQEGYHGFAMRKLAERLGYSATAIYGYFKNRDELIMELVHNGYLRLGEYMQSTAPDPIERLKEYARGYLKFALENRELYQLLFTHRPQFLFDNNEERVRSRLGLLINLATAVSELPAFAAINPADLKSLAFLLWAWMHGVISFTLTLPAFDEAWTTQNVEFVLERLEAILVEGKWLPSGPPPLYGIQS